MIPTVLIGWTPAIVAGLLIAASISATSRRQARGTDRPVAFLSIGALVLALVGVALHVVSSSGPVTDPTGLFRLDALSAVMMLLIAFLGAVILRFTQNYLDGDPRRPLFMARLSQALAAVAILVTTNNLVLFFVAWVATSILLHGLLLFHPERPRAVVAARKKFIFARIGDFCLLAGLAILALSFDTLSVGGVIEAASTSTATPGIVAASLLLAVAAILKCAQFPSHGWLTEVMETPTPVSALLHAGIINAGGFLLIRFSEVVVLSPGVLALLIVVGGFSALFGAVAMLPQTTVKGSLAHSTIAQMGFMLFQCGLGVFSAAALHLVAHSLYKAHAFLSSGRAVSSVAARAPTSPPSMAIVFGGLVLSLTVYLGVGALFPEGPAKSEAIMTLGAIFIAGLFVYAASAARASQAITIALLVTFASSFAYHGLQAASATVLAGVIPPIPEPDLFSRLVMVLAVLSFVLVAIAQSGVISVNEGLAGRLYVHLGRGLYANALNDRIIGALRLRKMV
jgi:NAD(P)H-quinone oxidoreductase subunit 5